jgi:hypothetical protein
MAATTAGRRATQQHREAQLALRASALRDMQRLWRTVDPQHLERTIGAFADAAALLIASWRARSADTSRRYVEALRRAEGGTGSITILADEAPPDAISAAAIRGAALAGILRSRRRGHSVEAATHGGFVSAAGTASSLVLAGGRDVVSGAVRGDDRAVGYMRVTSADPCAFCAMLASKGPVLGSPTAAEGFHDHCACTVEPIYRADAPDDRSQWPETSVHLREVWDAVTGGASAGAGGALEAFRTGLEAAAKGEALPAPDPTIGVEEF